MVTALFVLIFDLKVKKVARRLMTEKEERRIILIRWV
jgi:hypothetical protein